MDIFDKVKSEILGAASEVQDKAKDVTALMQLQREVKKKENYIQSVYEELGKKYYQDHKDDDSEDFSELEAAMARLEELKDEISNVKGMITCPNCGAKNPDYSTYCHKCGSVIADVETFSEEDVEVED